MTLFFAGSFNPFTAGHADIVERALRVADGVIIGVGVNAGKPGARAEAEARCRDISALYAGNPRVSVTAYHGLTATAAAAMGATALLRGIRSVKDFEYERDMAQINRRLTGIETVLLFADPALGAVSSSVVRELQGYGADVSAFLPRKAGDDGHKGK